MAVLVVEDDPDLRDNLSLLIQLQGYRTVTASHGREALDKLRRDALPCLVLLDLMMPIMDGWTLRSAMMKDARLAPIPVVLLSGVADLRDEAAALDAVDFLVKPVDLARLYALLAKHC